MKLWGKLHKYYYIIYTIISNNLGGYLSHYGGIGWGELAKKCDGLG